tara:strand:+ start:1614 stop:2384 length:771 start_codon:yes stop_codon:yes gene_type:complete
MELEIVDLNLTLTGQEKIDALISSLGAIKKRVEDGATITVGAIGYQALGGVVEDDTFNDGLITQDEFDSYIEAKDLVANHDYSTAENAQQLFMQEYNASMNDLDEALDLLTDATGEIMSGVGVMEAAAAADTSPEQEALQGLLGQEEYSIDQAEVDAYNQAVAQVESYAQQAGAFMAAANNTDLTASIDSYATQNNFVVGNYTMITYTQAMDEFVINWDDDGFGSGWQGYLAPDFKDAEDLYGAGEYIAQYGQMPD